jgi:Ca2+-binding RTX toxin-like protein
MRTPDPHTFTYAVALAAGRTHLRLDLPADARATLVVSRRADRRLASSAPAARAALLDVVAAASRSPVAPGDALGAWLVFNGRHVPRPRLLVNEAPARLGTAVAQVTEGVVLLPPYDVDVLAALAGSGVPVLLLCQLSPGALAAARRARRQVGPRASIAIALRSPTSVRGSGEAWRRAVAWGASLEAAGAGRPDLALRAWDPARAIAALAVGGTLVAAPVHAAVTSSIIGGTLFLTSNNDADAITVTCPSGVVQVNGVNVTGNPACPAISSIQVQGNGGADRLDLSAVTPATFHSMVLVSLAGGPGNDTILGSAFADRIQPSDVDDNDSVNGGGGIDTLIHTIDGFLAQSASLSDTRLTGIGVDTLASIEAAEIYGSGEDDTISALAFSGPVTLVGQAGDDTLIGSGKPDSLVGWEGNDRIEARGGADTVQGGDGVDTLEVGGSDGGVGNGTFVPDASGETAFVTTAFTLLLEDVEEVDVTGTTGADQIDASAFGGRVSLFGGPGNDTLIGTASDDTFIGEAGADSIVGNGGTDTFIADAPGVVSTLTATSFTTGGVVDVLSSIERAELSADGTGGRRIVATTFPGPVTLSGGDGPDTLVGGASDDQVGGFGGNDIIDGAGGINTLVESVSGTATLSSASLTNGTRTVSLNRIQRASITGGAGADRITASAFGFPVTLNGGSGGDDTLTGTGNPDVFVADGLVASATLAVSSPAAVDNVPSAQLTTGARTIRLLSLDRAELLADPFLNQPISINASNFLGRVTLSGGPLNDTLLGNSQPDVLTGGAGNDSINGGGGIDTLAETGVQNAVLTPTAMTGSLGTDVLTSIERVSLVGTSGRDTIDGGASGGPITVDGGSGGDDSLTGSTFDDVLKVASGAVRGGGGSDVITADGRSGSSLEVLLDGGAGDDRIAASFTTGTVLGGEGVDSIVVGEDATMLVDPGADGDLVTVQDEADFARVEALSAGDVVQGPTSGAARLDLILPPDARTITDTAVAFAGGGTATLSGDINNARLTGTSGAERLDASGFTGSVRLDGAGDDTLVGSASTSSTFVLSPGNFVITGGSSPSDRVQFTGGGATTITDTQIIGPTVQAALSGIEFVALTGSAGPDAVDASAASIRVSAQLGGGDDTFLGGSGPDTASGQSGNDSLIGNGGTDVLVGGPDNDVILGGDGNDSLADDAGVNQVNGGEGIDTASGAGGLVTVTPSAITSSPGLASTLSSIERVSISGTGGDDTLDASAFTPGPVTLRGAQGNDVLIGSPNDDLLDGGTGATTVTGNNGVDRFAATVITPNAQLTETKLADDVQESPFQSIERVEITHSTDLPGIIDASLFASGPVTLRAGGGGDTLIGSAAGDSLVGGDGSDELLGLGGNDSLVDETGGDDTMAGGSGDDVLSPGQRPGRLVLRGDAGTDTLLTSGGGAVALTDSSLQRTGATQLAFTSIERAILSGSVEADRFDVRAFAGAVTVSGGFGDDTVVATLSQQVNADGGNGTDLVEVFVDSADTPDVTATSVNSGGVAAVSYSTTEQVITALANGTGIVPSLTVTSPSTAASTSTTAFVPMAGTIANFPADRVEFQTDRGGRGTGTLEGPSAFSVGAVPLQPGVNRVIVTARDGQTDSVSAIVTVQVNELAYYLAEGATGPFFDADILVANPNTTDAPIAVTFLRENGATVERQYTVPAQRRLTINMDAEVGDASQVAASTVVRSTAGLPLAVERTMFWDPTGYGSHGGAAVDGPSTRWVFAEGSQTIFDTFVLLANATSAPANVRVTYLREAPDTPVVEDVVVPANARVTLHALNNPALVGKSFAIDVTSDVPVIAERAMYFGTARFFDGGHESPGVTAPARRWFLAEGATGAYFDTYILVGNTSDRPANVTLRFLTDAGRVVTRQKLVPPRTRLTVNIEQEDPILANVAVSTTVESDVPVVAERAMYWPGPFQTWFEAHNSFGSTETATKWGLGEGRVGGPRGFETFILLANPDPTREALVKVTYLRESGEPVVVENLRVTPNSRRNIYVNVEVPQLVNESFGAVVEVTNGVPIAVERAMYSNALGVVWAAGANVLATRLP